MTTVRKMVDVDVEVDLEDFDTEELIEELRTRGEIGQDNKSKVQAIYDAFHQGRDALAVELTKQYVCDVLGRVL